MKALCNEIIANINRNARPRSAWSVGVQRYAMELLDDLDGRMDYEGREPADVIELEQWLLNGAANWKTYSWGGSSLIYNGDIAKRLCTASELKKTREGTKAPNRDEDWLDVQARALRQASALIRYIYVDITATATVKEA